MKGRRLKLPKEPEMLKEQIEAMRRELEKEHGEDINWESLAAWYGNRLPSYLWREWKEELKAEGFNWQKFLKLMSYNKHYMILWARGKMSWESFVEKIGESLEGSVGEMIRRFG